MRHSIRRLLVSSIVLFSLGLAIAATETDIVGSYAVDCEFKVKNFRKVDRDRSFDGPDTFSFNGDHSLGMTFYVPGAGTWAFDALANTWSGDMALAADPFLEGMLGYPVDVESMGIRKVTRTTGGVVAGKLRGKWKNHKGGTTFKSKLKGNFSGTLIT